MERPGSFGVPNAGVRPFTPTPGYHLDGRSGEPAMSLCVWYLLTGNADAYPRWLLRHPCYQDRSTVA
jgi:hypothetical protein